MRELKGAQMKKLLSLCILITGCAIAKVPVKIGKAVTPPIAIPVTKATAKVGANAVKESVMLPIRVVKDSVPKAKAQPAKKAPKAEPKKQDKPVEKHGK
jgi:hypothetical protein